MKEKEKRGRREKEVRRKEDERRKQIAEKEKEKEKGRRGEEKRGRSTGAALSWRAQRDMLAKLRRVSWITPWTRSRGEV